ncbi:MAG: peptidyl-prolyl cis-trans isomerase SurA [Candidatus Azotimanducaceae bacterium]|jgi:peptidyl-prolyl cis-trans isomerase SurA
MNKFTLFGMSFCTVLLSSAMASADMVILDQIAVVVDDDVVMESEVESRRRAVVGQLKGQDKRLPPDDIMRQQIIERLIVENLQLQMADRAGIRVSDEELNSALGRIAAQNELTLAQFSLEIEKDGISYLEMRDQVRREIAISRVRDGVMRRRIKVTEQEIQVFLQSELGQTLTADEYRLAHILLPFQEGADSESINRIKESANALIDELNGGADFQTLAIERSTASDALEGGDLGWRKSVQLPTMFSDVAVNMELGDIRGPIKSGSGYHVVTLLDKRGAKTEGRVEQTQVRHLLIQPSEIMTEEEAREFAESLRTEVLEGRPFDEIAKLHSDDPGSALSGGDLGWSAAGAFVPEFEAHIASTSIEETSPVFRSQHGYHFLEVTGHRIEDMSEEFLKRQAANFLRNQKMDEELESWVRELREDAFVEIRS